MDPRGAGPSSSLLATLGAGALACSSALAAYRSRRDPGSLAFAAAAYAALLLLLRSLRGLERAAPADRGRARARAAVWALSTLLTAMFAARVAPLMPLAAGVAVWVVAGATAAGGFWAFFVAR